MRYFILIFLSLISSACLKTNEVAPQSPKKKVDLSIVGLSTFGNILLGEKRETMINIRNNSSAAVRVEPQVSNPFSVSGIQEECSGGLLPSGSSCRVKLEFFPTSVGKYKATFLVEDSSVEVTGSAIVGGDITVSETNIDLGQISAGVEIFKTITLTNVGDFSINFPQFTLPSGTKLISNYCGSYLNSKVSCDIKFQIVKESVGQQADIILMKATSSGSGTATTPITLNSVVRPGIPTGTISLDGQIPQFVANDTQEETFVSKKIVDIFGNTVKDGTDVIVSVSNLSIVGESNIFKTVDGIVTFKVKSNKTKGPGTISLVSGNAFGLIPFYIRADLPFGEIKLQPYSSSLIADGKTELFLKTEKIYDKFRNPVEDGTEIELSTLGGGTLSSDRLFFSQVLRARTFDGIARFYLKSGTIAGQAVLSAKSNPAIDPLTASVFFLSTGNFPIQYIPGGPIGDIPIVSSREALNAVTDFAIVTVGPILDSMSNIVSNNTPVNLTILNGRTIDNNVQFFTDTEGKFQFIVVGSGNRGPINISLAAEKASGFKSIWAYKDSHLTFQGQKRDDLGIGTGSDKLNSGRAFTRYARAAIAQHELPSVSLKGDEVFDYGRLTSSDSSFLAIQRLSSPPVSSSSEVVPFSVKIPTQQTIDNIINYTSLKAVPNFFADVFYSAGENIVSAPYWTKSIITPGTDLFGCGSSSPDQNQNYLLNSLVFTPSTGNFSCKLGNSVITSSTESDRENQARSNLSYASIGYAEDPLGCSFSDGQSPIYNFSIGEFTRNNLIEKTIELYNPSPLTAENVSISINSGADNGWSVQNLNCSGSLEQGESCFYKVIFLNQNIAAGFYSSNMTINSSITPIQATFDVQITQNTSASGVSGNQLGKIDIKSNCFSKLAVFGGHDYVYTSAARKDTIAKTTKLLSLYNGKGQSIGRFDGQCSGFSTQLACESEGFGCVWVPNPFPTCREKIDLGDFPSKGTSLSPIVPVGRKMYMFSGFDASGDGDPSPSSLLEMNAESNVWSKVTVKPNENVPEDVIDPLIYREPQVRYLHGMVYVPEAKSLFLYGGLGINNRRLNDMWKLNLFPDKVIDPDLGNLVTPPLTWELVCMDCLPLPGNSIFTIVTRLITEGPGVIGADEPSVPYLIWSRAHQKLFILFKEKSEIYSLDPLSSDLVGSINSLPASVGLNAFAGSNQVIYNHKNSRILGYFKDPNSQTNYFKLWDMDSQDKTYLRVRFNLGAQSKQYATTINPRIRGYGSSGPDVSGVCGALCEGLTAYIYNHDRSQWFTIGEHNVSSVLKLTQDKEIGASFNDADARELISSDGYVDLMITSRGIPTEFNQMFIDSIFLDGTF